MSITDRTFIIQETAIGISQITVGFDCETETFYAYTSTMLPDGDVEVSAILSNYEGIREAQLAALDLIKY
jgi:hypothetical protein